MKIKKKYSAMLVLLLLALLTVVLVGCFRGGKYPERMQKHISKKLELTQEQQASLKVSVKQYQSLWKESKDIVEQMKETIILEIQKDKVDGDSVGQQLQDKINEINAMVPKYTTLFADFHATLDASQKAKLAEIAKDYDDKKGRKKHRRNKKGGGYDDDHDDDDDK